MSAMKNSRNGVEKTRGGVVAQIERTFTTSNVQGLPRGYFDDTKGALLIRRYAYMDDGQQLIPIFMHMTITLCHVKCT